jgi:hypothetical protein
MIIRGTIAISILCFFILSGCMPTLVPAKTTTVQKIIEVPGVSKEVIYERSMVWFAQTFRSSKAVIQYENRETGVIIGQGIVHYFLSYGLASGDVPVRFTMKEDIKDGRVRVTFDNLLEGTKEIPVTYQLSMDYIRPKLLSLADDLGAALVKPATSDSW